MASESRAQSCSEPRPDSTQTREDYARLRAEARSLRAATKALRLALVKARLDLALRIAMFPDARASDKFVEACRNEALRTYHFVRSSINGDGWTGMDRVALEERLDGLRAALEIGEKAAGEVNDNAVSATPPTLDRESAIRTRNDHDRNRLTTRELEVLKCIVEGYSTKEVALMLGITFKTAACHRYRIMDKLDLHSTASLVRYAIRSGLVAA